MSLDDSQEQEGLWPPTNSCNNVDHSLAPVDNNNICKNIISIIMIWTCPSGLVFLDSSLTRPLPYILHVSVKY